MFKVLEAMLRWFNTVDGFGVAHCLCFQMGKEVDFRLNYLCTGQVKLETMFGGPRDAKTLSYPKQKRSILLLLFKVASVAIEQFFFVLSMFFPFGVIIMG